MRQTADHRLTCSSPRPVSDGGRWPVAALLGGSGGGGWRGRGGASGRGVASGGGGGPLVAERVVTLWQLRRHVATCWTVSDPVWWRGRGQG